MAIVAQAAVQASPAAVIKFSSISSTDRACSALRRAMWREGYNETIIGETLALARKDGDLVEAIDSGRICPEDADQFTEVFAGSFDAVPFDSDAWDDEDRWTIAGELPPTDAELAVALTKHRDIPSDADSRAFAALDARYDVRGRLSDDDWSDYLAWAEWHEATFPPLPDYEPQELAEVGFRAGCEV